MFQTGSGQNAPTPTGCTHNTSHHIVILDRQLPGQSGVPGPEANLGPCSSSHLATTHKGTDFDKLMYRISVFRIRIMRGLQDPVKKQK